MQFATVFSRSTLAVDAPLVRVEVHISDGLPRVSIVGLAETAVQESKERVRAAIQNSRLKFPASQRVTINLAPADMPKEGGRYDLPIAIGVLLAFGQLTVDGPLTAELVGELSLDGVIRPVCGALPMALAARDAGRAVILPVANAAEAALARAAQVYPARTLLEVCAHLNGQHALTLQPRRVPSACDVSLPDLADVRGQQHARRALEIAAAGSHSLLLIGPPGTGKTMLAERLPGILPPLSEEQALQTAALASLRGERDTLECWRRRPFRAPHHTASAAALAGGGRHPRPGELSLAHNGVLFLDELPEFERRVLEVLRQPLESGKVAIARAAAKIEFPARVQLVAAMNPCPCGYHGDPDRDCRCSDQRIAKYRQKISGPLLDRIDMHVEVPRCQIDILAPAPDVEGSEVVRQRVSLARENALQRGGLNAHIPGTLLTAHGQATGSARELLTSAARRLNLSARAQHKVLRLARTIADLAGSERVTEEHIAEGIGLRRMDGVH